MASPEARFFTLDELSKYDGSDTSLPIYICVQVPLHCSHAAYNDRW